MATLDEALRVSGAVRLGPEDRLVLVSEEPLSEEQVKWIRVALAERGLSERAVIVASGLAALRLLRNDDRGKDVAARVVDRIYKRLEPLQSDGMAWRAALNGVIAEVVADEIEATGDIRAALGTLCDLVLDEMPVVPLGGEEARVWSKIEKTALSGRSLLS